MSTELATCNKYNFELAPVGSDLGDIITEEMDGLGPIPLDAIKIPSGGALSFELPGETEDTPVAVQELVGIVVDHHPVNVYWATSYDGDGGGNPPDCASYDGKTGLDADSLVTRACASCPYNQFGSGANGGKACKNMHRIYILLSGQPLPMLLTLPPTSIKAWRDYLAKKVIVYNKRPYMVLTKVSLKKEKSAQGKAYSKAVFAKVADFTPEECAVLWPMVESFRTITRAVPDNSQGVEPEPQSASFEVLDGEDNGLPF